MSFAKISISESDSDSTNDLQVRDDQINAERRNAIRNPAKSILP